jgi:hypothetical protein
VSSAGTSLAPSRRPLATAAVAELDPLVGRDREAVRTLSEMRGELRVTAELVELIEIYTRPQPIG